MDKVQLKLYQERWQALREFEKLEALTETIEMRWQKVNFLYGMAKSMGIKTDDAKEEKLVRARWLQLIKKAGL
jgi:hypothetical protein